MPNAIYSQHPETLVSSTSKDKNPDHFILPDLVADCPYTPRSNPNCYEQARKSEKWLLSYAKHNPKKTAKFMGLKAGELTASCYPDADARHLRTCDDFMNYLFNLDDWLDEFDVNDTNGMHECCIGAMKDSAGFRTDKKAGLLTKDFFSRFEETAGKGCRQRFIDSMDLFFVAVAKQSRDRVNGIIPNLDSYIETRRDTSGCKPCFQLIEYAGRFDLPQFVVECKEIQEMEEATNDLVTWSNDIFSYNKEQERNDTHNMIPVTMHQYGYSLQQAIDHVGQKCKESIERFEHNRQKIREDKKDRWDQDTKKMVEMYADGLQNWIVGSLHWSFESERYFGKAGLQVKKDRLVKLSPRRPLVPASHN
ncbi:terpene synthase [Macrolepiota fuliginosa MF-IS2]|uniref:Terpene synthase n=1 Tax=Macrolepiota fuliginosa MF-IS2 TaxID=1400762 RepID=A0A9P5XFH2_9AGAR|nr:terpene synthase [Macrolepiota fuliginosa MF-IS2]